MPDLAAACEQQAENIQFLIDEALAKMYAHKVNLLKYLDKQLKKAKVTKLSELPIYLDKTSAHLSDDINSLLDILLSLDITKAFSNLRKSTRKAVHLWKEEKLAKQEIDKLTDFLMQEMHGKEENFPPGYSFVDDAIRLIKSYKAKQIRLIENTNPNKLTLRSKT